MTFRINDVVIISPGFVGYEEKDIYIGQEAVITDIESWEYEGEMVVKCTLDIVRQPLKESTFFTLDKNSYIYAFAEVGEISHRRLFQRII